MQNPFPRADDDRNVAASPPRAATLREVIGAVAWSFFGVRKGDAMQRDAVSIRAHQVIIVGAVGAAMLVLSLVALVRWIVGGV
ncbi:MAG: DUF2970 domain-containing protein [Betaproteobacteria bacterium]